MPAAGPGTRAVQLLLRQSRLSARRTTTLRHASTVSEAASHAKDTAAGAASKASEGLSRVQTSAGSAISSAGSAITNAASGVRGSLSKVGGRTGRIIAFVDSLIPPTVYYARVGLELSKLVFQGRKMSPPTLAQFQSYLSPLTNTIRNPRSIGSNYRVATNGATAESMLSSVRHVSFEQLASLGIVAAEIVGFYTVGTMIGRMKIIGYHGEPAHHGGGH